MSSSAAVHPDDDFGFWYRFKCLVVFNLLYVAGPAQLDSHNDPRKALEQEYTRRRDLHRERLGKPPVQDKPVSQGTGPDLVVLCAVGGALAVVILIIWAVVA